MIPIPPSRAIVIAISDSVIVSMLALMSGIFNVIFVESRVFNSVWDLEIMGDRLGIRRTSSKVNPSRKDNVSLNCTHLQGL